MSVSNTGRKENKALNKVLEENKRGLIERALEIRAKYQDLHIKSKSGFRVEKVRLYDLPKINSFMPCDVNFYFKNSGLNSALSVGDSDTSEGIDAKKDADRKVDEGYGKDYYIYLLHERQKLSYKIDGSTDLIRRLKNSDSIESFEENFPSEGSDKKYYIQLSKFIFDKEEIKDLNRYIVENNNPNTIALIQEEIDKEIDKLDNVNQKIKYYEDFISIDFLVNKESLLMNFRFINNKEDFIEKFDSNEDKIFRKLINILCELAGSEINKPETKFEYISKYYKQGEFYFDINKINKIFQDQNNILNKFKVYDVKKMNERLNRIYLLIKDAKAFNNQTTRALEGMNTRTLDVKNNLIDILKNDHKTLCFIIHNLRITNTVKDGITDKIKSIHEEIKETPEVSDELNVEIVKIANILTVLDLNRTDLNILRSLNIINSKIGKDTVDRISNILTSKLTDEKISRLDLLPFTLKNAKTSSEKFNIAPNFYIKKFLTEEDFQQLDSIKNEWKDYFEQVSGPIKNGDLFLRSTFDAFDKTQKEFKFVDEAARQFEKTGAYVEKEKRRRLETIKSTMGAPDQLVIPEEHQDALNAVLDVFTTITRKQDYSNLNNNQYIIGDLENENEYISFSLLYIVYYVNAVRDRLFKSLNPEDNKYVVDVSKRLEVELLLNELESIYEFNDVEFFSSEINAMMQGFSKFINLFKKQDAASGISKMLLDLLQNTGFDDKNPAIPQFYTNVSTDKADKAEKEAEKLEKSLEKIKEKLITTSDKQEIKSLNYHKNKLEKELIAKEEEWRISQITATRAPSKNSLRQEILVVSREINHLYENSYNEESDNIRESIENTANFNSKLEELELRMKLKMYEYLNQLSEFAKRTNTATNSKIIDIDNLDIIKTGNPSLQVFFTPYDLAKNYKELGIEIPKLLEVIGNISKVKLEPISLLSKKIQSVSSNVFPITVLPKANVEHNSIIYNFMFGDYDLLKRTVTPVSKENLQFQDIPRVINQRMIYNLGILNQFSTLKTNNPLLSKVNEDEMTFYLKVLTSAMAEIHFHINNNDFGITKVDYGESQFAKEINAFSNNILSGFVLKLNDIVGRLSQDPEKEDILKAFQVVNKKMQGVHQNLKTIDYNIISLEIEALIDTQKTEYWLLDLDEEDVTRSLNYIVGATNKKRKKRTALKEELDQLERLDYCDYSTLIDVYTNLLSDSEKRRQKENEKLVINLKREEFLSSDRKEKNAIFDKIGEVLDSSPINRKLKYVKEYMSLNIPINAILNLKFFQDWLDEKNQQYNKFVVNLSNELSRGTISEEDKNEQIREYNEFRSSLYKKTEILRKAIAENEIEKRNVLRDRLGKLTVESNLNDSFVNRIFSYRMDENPTDRPLNNISANFLVTVLKNLSKDNYDLAKFVELIDRIYPSKTPENSFASNQEVLRILPKLIDTQKERAIKYHDGAAPLDVDNDEFLIKLVNHLKVNRSENDLLVKKIILSLGTNRATVNEDGTVEVKEFTKLSEYVAYFKKFNSAIRESMIDFEKTILTADGSMFITPYDKEVDVANIEEVDVTKIDELNQKIKDNTDKIIELAKINEWITLATVAKKIENTKTNTPTESSGFIKNFVKLLNSNEESGFKQLANVLKIDIGVETNSENIKTEFVLLGKSFETLRELSNKTEVLQNLFTKLNDVINVTLNQFIKSNNDLQAIEDFVRETSVVFFDNLSKAQDIQKETGSPTEKDKENLITELFHLKSVGKLKTESYIDSVKETFKKFQSNINIEIFLTTEAREELAQSLGGYSLSLSDDEKTKLKLFDDQIIKLEEILNRKTIEKDEILNKFNHFIEFSFTGESKDRVLSDFHDEYNKLMMISLPRMKQDGKAINSIMKVLLPVFDELFDIPQDLVVEMLNNSGIEHFDKFNKKIARTQMSPEVRENLAKFVNSFIGSASEKKEEDIKKNGLTAVGNVPQVVKQIDSGTAEKFVQMKAELSILEKVMINSQNMYTDLTNMLPTGTSTQINDVDNLARTLLNLKNNITTFIFYIIMNTEYTRYKNNELKGVKKERYAQLEKLKEQHLDFYNEILSGNTSIYTTDNRSYKDIMEKKVDGKDVSISLNEILNSDETVEYQDKTDKKKYQIPILLHMHVLLMRKNHAVSALDFYFNYNPNADTLAKLHTGFVNDENLDNSSYKLKELKETLLDPYIEKLVVDIEQDETLDKIKKLYKINEIKEEWETLKSDIVYESKNDENAISEIAEKKKFEKDNFGIEQEAALNEFTAKLEEEIDEKLRLDINPSSYDNSLYTESDLKSKIKDEYLYEIQSLAFEKDTQDKLDEILEQQKNARNSNLDMADVAIYKDGNLEGYKKVNTKRLSNKSSALGKKFTEDFIDQNFLFEKRNEFNELLKEWDRKEKEFDTIRDVSIIKQLKSICGFWKVQQLLSINFDKIGGKISNLHQVHFTETLPEAENVYKNLLEEIGSNFGLNINQFMKLYSARVKDTNPNNRTKYNKVLEELNMNDVPNIVDFSSIKDFVKQNGNKTLAYAGGLISQSENGFPFVISLINTMFNMNREVALDKNELEVLVNLLMEYVPSPIEMKRIHQYNKSDFLRLIIEKYENIQNITTSIYSIQTNIDETSEYLTSIFTNGNSGRTESSSAKLKIIHENYGEIDREIKESYDIYVEQTQALIADCMKLSRLISHRIEGGEEVVDKELAVLTAMSEQVVAKHRQTAARRRLTMNMIERRFNGQTSSSSGVSSSDLERMIVKDFCKVNKEAIDRWNSEDNILPLKKINKDLSDEDKAKLTEDNKEIIILNNKNKNDKLVPEFTMLFKQFKESSRFKSICAYYIKDIFEDFGDETKSLHVSDLGLNNSLLFSAIGLTKEGRKIAQKKNYKFTDDSFLKNIGIDIAYIREDDEYKENYKAKPVFETQEEEREYRKTFIPVGEELVQEAYEFIKNHINIVKFNDEGTPEVKIENYIDIPEEILEKILKGRKLSRKEMSESKISQNAEDNNFIQDYKEEFEKNADRLYIKERLLEDSNQMDLLRTLLDDKQEELKHYYDILEELNVDSYEDLDADGRIIIVQIEDIKKEILEITNRMKKLSRETSGNANVLPSVYLEEIVAIRASMNNSVENMLYFLEGNSDANPDDADKITKGLLPKIDSIAKNIKAGKTLVDYLKSFVTIDQIRLKMKLTSIESEQIDLSLNNQGDYPLERFNEYRDNSKELSERYKQHAKNGFLDNKESSDLYTKSKELVEEYSNASEVVNRNIADIRAEKTIMGDKITVNVVTLFREFINIFFKNNGINVAILQRITMELRNRITVEDVKQKTTEIKSDTIESAGQDLVDFHLSTSSQTSKNFETEKDYTIDSNFKAKFQLKSDKLGNKRNKKDYSDVIENNSKSLDEILKITEFLVSKKTPFSYNLELNKFRKDLEKKLEENNELMKEASSISQKYTEEKQNIISQSGLGNVVRNRIIADYEGRDHVSFKKETEEYSDLIDEKEILGKEYRELGEEFGKKKAEAKDREEPLDPKVLEEYQEKETLLKAQLNKVGRDIDSKNSFRNFENLASKNIFMALKKIIDEYLRRGSYLRNKLRDRDIDIDIFEGFKNCVMMFISQANSSTLKERDINSNLGAIKKLYNYLIKTIIATNTNKSVFGKGRENRRDMDKFDKDLQEFIKHLKIVNSAIFTSEDEDEHAPENELKEDQIDRLDRNHYRRVRINNKESFDSTINKYFTISKIKNLIESEEEETLESFVGINNINNTTFSFDIGAVPDTSSSKFKALVKDVKVMEANKDYYESKLEEAFAEFFGKTRITNNQVDQGEDGKRIFKEVVLDYLIQVNILLEENISNVDIENIILDLDPFLKNIRSDQASLQGKIKSLTTLTVDTEASVSTPFIADTEQTRQYQKVKGELFRLFKSRQHTQEKIDRAKESLENEGVLDQQIRGANSSITRNTNILNNIELEIDAKTVVLKALESGDPENRSVVVHKVRKDEFQKIVDLAKPITGGEYLSMDPKYSSGNAFINMFARQNSGKGQYNGYLTSIDIFKINNSLYIIPEVVYNVYLSLKNYTKICDEDLEQNNIDDYVVFIDEVSTVLIEIICSLNNISPTLSHDEKITQIKEKNLSKIYGGSFSDDGVSRNVEAIIQAVKKSELSNIFSAFFNNFEPFKTIKPLFDSKVGKIKTTIDNIDKIILKSKVKVNEEQDDKLVEAKIKLALKDVEIDKMNKYDAEYRTAYAVWKSIGDASAPKPKIENFENISKFAVALAEMKTERTDLQFVVTELMFKNEALREFDEPIITSDARESYINISVSIIRVDKDIEDIKQEITNIQNSTESDGLKGITVLVSEIEKLEKSIETMEEKSVELFSKNINAFRELIRSLQLNLSLISEEKRKREVEILALEAKKLELESILKEYEDSDTSSGQELDELIILKANILSSAEDVVKQRKNIEENKKQTQKIYFTTPREKIVNDSLTNQFEIDLSIEDDKDFLYTISDHVMSMYNNDAVHRNHKNSGADKKFGTHNTARMKVRLDGGDYSFNQFVNLTRQFRPKIILNYKEYLISLIESISDETILENVKANKKTFKKYLKTKEEIESSEISCSKKEDELGLTKNNSGSALVLYKEKMLELGVGDDKTFKEDESFIEIMKTAKELNKISIPDYSELEIDEDNPEQSREKLMEIMDSLEEYMDKLSLHLFDFYKIKFKVANIEERFIRKINLATKIYSNNSLDESNELLEKLITICQDDEKLEQNYDVDTMINNYKRSYNMPSESNSNHVISDESLEIISNFIKTKIIEEIKLETYAKINLISDLLSFYSESENNSELIVVFNNLKDQYSIIKNNYIENLNNYGKEDSVFFDTEISSRLGTSGERFIRDIKLEITDKIKILSRGKINQSDKKLQKEYSEFMNYLTHEESGIIPKSKAEVLRSITGMDEELKTKKTEKQKTDEGMVDSNNSVVENLKKKIARLEIEGESKIEEYRKIMKLQSYFSDFTFEDYIKMRKETLEGIRIGLRVAILKSRKPKDQVEGAVSLGTPKVISRTPVTLSTDTPREYPKAPSYSEQESDLNRVRDADALEKAKLNLHQLEAALKKTPEGEKKDQLTLRVQIARNTRELLQTKADK